MQPAHAYVGIGIVFILSLIAFVNPSLLGAGKSTASGVTSGGKNQSMTDTFKLTSPAFEDGASIPRDYTCDGILGSPPLEISGAPVNTKSFAITVEDPDVPKKLMPDGVFLHWVLFNIPADTTTLTVETVVGISGKNGAGKTGYVGPCPPPQYEPSRHRYVFTLYALDSALPLKEGATKDVVMEAMKGHVLSQAQLIGNYKVEK